MENEILTPSSKRWGFFVEKLSGKDGCNFDGDGEDLGWKCSGTIERPLARKILTDIGDVDIKETLEYFSKHGGYCDCEILFNVHK